MSLRTHSWLPTFPAAARRGAVTIGNFDGVHRGHAVLLARLRELARQWGGSAVVVTFDPHPLMILRPEQCLPMLTQPVDRIDLLKVDGADEVVVVPTTVALLHLSAREFFDEVIQDRLAPLALVEGPDFGFGHNREGNIALLTTWCHEAGIHLEIVEPVKNGGVPISSSRIRTALLEGNMGEAARLLGRPYRLRGRVGMGQKRGNTLGFPTANLEGIATLIPADGVYAVRVEAGSACWAGAANVGPNPTFGEQVRKVEVHIIGFHGDLYGRTLAVDFLDRLRPTQPFASPDALVKQLNHDVAAAQRIAGFSS